jgi:nitrate reductase cytochrome c-type subunit
LRRVVKLKTNFEGGFKMKRLVLLVVALVFAMGTTVMAAENAAPAKEEPAKVEKAEQKAPAKKVKKAKKTKKAKKAEKKAEEKKVEEAAPAAPAAK